MISPLRYMGSKRSLAPTIADVIHARHPGAIVADAFAGTCAVATALAPKHPVYANDIHAFAAVIARTLLTERATLPLPSRAWDELGAPFTKNLQSLREQLEWELAREAALLTRVKRPRAWADFKAFAEGALKRRVPLKLGDLGPIEDYKARPSRKPYCLFSRYFANAYFGVRQAAEIDSLRAAIDAAPPKYRNFYLFALLYATSHCAAAPGHFAQFLVPRDERNTLYVARIRSRSVVEYFKEALLQLRRPACLDRARNRVFQADAVDFLAELASRRRSKSLVIYADPPYSKAQYSRYYHVLETLVLYDYPAVTSKGRYRDGRFETGFCRKSQVVDAMDQLIAGVAAADADLYLSYPKNGLLYQAGGDVRRLLKKHFHRVSTAASVELDHSTMGAAPGSASLRVTEDVYYAER